MHPRNSYLKSFCAMALVLAMFIGILITDNAAALGKELTPANRAEAKNLTATYPALDAYATDLTELARQGALAPQTGFTKEIKRAMQVLAADNGRNIMLLDDKGTGRIQVAQGLAIRIASGDAPNSLLDKHVFSLDVNRLATGAADNQEIAVRLQSIADAMSKAPEVILFIDGFDTLVGSSATYGPETSNAIQAALGKNQIHVIGGSTHNGYDASIAADAKLAGLFEKIAISDDAAVAKNDSDTNSQPFVGDKVSPELREMMSNGTSGKVSAILQVDDSQNAELSQLLQDNGIKVSQRMNGALAVRMPISVIDSLSNNGLILHMSRDRETMSFGHVSLETGTDAAVAQTYSSISRADGTGVGIAIVDSGIDVVHTGFLNSAGTASRVVFSKNFVTTESTTNDLYGHGTHVAGLAAGNDRVAAGAYRGVAPDANLINLRVLDGQGRGKTSYLLAALNWVELNYQTYNVRVVNLSLGSPALESYSNDPVCRAVRRLTDLGIVVVAAAGNSGKNALGQKVYGQIHSPGNEPSAITVGASNSFGTTARSDDGVATFSSRGPTRSYWTSGLLGTTKHYDNVLKPDLVAPGNKLVSTRPSAGCYLTNLSPSLMAYDGPGAADAYFYLSGTSMASPVVAGAAALMLEVNPSLNPDLVKVLLQYSATPIKNFNLIEQGAGQLNVAGATKLADLVRRDLTSTTALGSNLLTSAAPAPQTQIDVVYTWSQGVTFDYTYATGTDLITKVQRAYVSTQHFGSGIVVGAGGTLVRDGGVLTTGITVGRNIVTSAGGVLGTGTALPSALRGSGVLVSDGVLLSDGVLVADGVLLSDGVLTSDGVLVADGVLLSDSLEGLSVLFNGDNTAYMR